MSTEAPVTPRPAARRHPPGTYRPLDTVFLRVAALPVSAYPDGDGDDLQAAARDPLVRLALTVASPSLAQALERADGRPLPARTAASLRRYLIRMATRPTPFGVFAGVALARLGESTDLELGDAQPGLRCRPDMDWLLRFVIALEARPEVRRRLRLFAHPSAVVLGGRVRLGEPAPRGEAEGGAPVSIRASAAVLTVLTEAREPTTHDALVGALVARVPGADEARAGALIDALWRQTFLLTELRPGLVGGDPAQVLSATLGRSDTGREIASELTARIDAARRLEATRTPDAVHPDLEIDSTAAVHGGRLHRAVADEAARAAELLLRFSPLGTEPSGLAAYRRAFAQRYEAGRCVPLLEALDEDHGLRLAAATTSSERGRPSSAALARRRDALLTLAVDALAERRSEVELDDSLIAALTLHDPNTDPMPPSLDLYAMVGARSAEAIDRGEFALTVGPNVGALAGGRNLGRFADMFGPAGVDVLREIATAEDDERLACELVYQPRRLRSTNVIVRPLARTHQICLNVPPSAGAIAVPPAELALTLERDTFRLWWTRTGEELRVCVGHMLNDRHAPGPARFLSLLARDRCVQMCGFDWGPAWSLPRLPRVRSGRVVLRAGEWLLSSGDADPADPHAFAAALERWRRRWDVPPYIHTGGGDNRLALDLDHPDHREELRRTLAQRTRLRVQEVIPALDEAWLASADGTAHASEIVISLVRRPRPATNGRPARPRRHGRLATHTGASRLRPPGSDWLFAKLYGGRGLEDELLARDLPAFLEAARGTFTQWFFIRYADPDPHLRLRFHGDPDTLQRGLLPQLTAWTGELIEAGRCHRLTLDTYERELERYGGPAGMALAEQIFWADSQAVLDILANPTTPDRLELAVMTLDDLLDALGLDARQRIDCYAASGAARTESGPEYRLRKARLRDLLTGGTASPILDRRRARIAPVAAQMTTAAAPSFGHLHLNRLLGSDPRRERLIKGLALRTNESLLRAPPRR